MRAKKGFVGNTEVYFTICSTVFINCIVIDGDMRVYNEQFTQKCERKMFV